MWTPQPGERKYSMLLYGLAWSMRELKPHGSCDRLWKALHAQVLSCECPEVRGRPLGLSRLSRLSTAQPEIHPSARQEEQQEEQPISHGHPGN